MSLIESALHSHLTSDAAVSTIVGTRVYPLLIPQDASLPAIAYQRISALRVTAQDGPSNLARSRLQVTCVAESYSGVKALATAVRQALHGYKGTVDGVTVGASFLETDVDQYADESGLYSVQMDFRIWYGET